MPNFVSDLGPEIDQTDSYSDPAAFRDEFAEAEDCWGCLVVPKVDAEQVRLVCYECSAVAVTIAREQFEGGYVPDELRSEEVATAQR